MMGIRRLSALFLGPIFLALLFLLVASAAQAREMVSIARENVNMRAGPGTRHEALWGLARGFPLEVLGRRGNWVQVRDFERDKGWVLRSLTQRKAHHIVRSKVANLRAGPGTRHRVVGKVLYGDVLRTLERRGGWVRLSDGQGRRGWVARKLLWGW